MKQYPLQLDLISIKKNAKKSWKDSFQGKEMLGQLPDIGLKEVPYYVLKDYIHHFEDLLFGTELDYFHQAIIEKKLLEYQLLFIYRYEWEFGRNKAPFGMKWIFDKYKDLYSSRDLHQYLGD